MNDKIQKYIDLVMAKARESGIATFPVGNDRAFMISKVKLMELYKQVEDSGKDVALIIVKNPDTFN